MVILVTGVINSHGRKQQLYGRSAKPKYRLSHQPQSQTDMITTRGLLAHLVLYDHTTVMKQTSTEQEEKHGQFAGC